MVLAEPRRAEARADLLVCSRAEDQIARRLEALARQRRDRNGFRRDLPLHVERAAPPNLAVAQLAAKRVGAPLRRVCEHDVGVGKEEQRGTVAPTWDARDEVRALGDLRVQLAGDARVFEIAAQQLRCGGLVARRVRRVDANELLQELRHFLAQRRNLNGHGRAPPFRRLPLPLRAQ